MQEEVPSVLDLSSLEPVTVRVKLPDGDYVLREPDEAAASGYRNKCMAAAKLEDGKLRGMDGLADTAAYLVGRCLYKVGANGEPVANPVGEQRVRGMPAKLVRPVFELCKRIGQLDEADETPESLRRQIKALQDRLARTEAAAGGATGPKDTPATTPDT